MADKGRTADGQMTLIEHLGELRHRVFICAIAVGVGAVVDVHPATPEVLHFLAGPYRDVTAGRNGCGKDGCDLIATDPLAPFLVRLKIAGYGGLALALPVVHVGDLALRRARAEPERAQVRDPVHRRRRRAVRRSAASSPGSR